MVETQHRYLGELEHVDHALPFYFMENTTVSLPLVYLYETILFPGEELPLRMLSSGIGTHIVENVRHQGIILAVASRGQGSEIYGTTVRAEKLSVTTEAAAITGIGKQRFAVQRVRHVNGNSLEADVLILPEYVPIDVPHFSGFPNNRIRKISCAFWDDAAFRLFDAQSLIRKIKLQLLSSHRWIFLREIGHKSHHISKIFNRLEAKHEADPVNFSFWAARNLPIDQKDRLKLLSINCTVHRLRLLLNLLNKDNLHVGCRRCLKRLADIANMISMTNEGVNGTFVNPGGFVHQILTFMKVHEEHIFNNNERSSEDSWFDGYTWSIITCNSCYDHLGWRFDAEQNTSVPNHFFGFRRGSLVFFNGEKQYDTPVYSETDLLYDLD